MKPSKKILAILISIAMIFCFTSIGIAEDAISAYERNSNEATNGYSKLFESFGLEGLTAIPSYPQAYGGAYIDDNGNLVVQYVGNKASGFHSRNDLQEITSLTSLTTEQVEFSYNELVSANNAIGEYIVNNQDSALEPKQIPVSSSFKGGIFKSAIDAKNNAVIVWLEDISDSNIEAFRKTIFDAPFLKFMLASKERPTLETTYKSGDGWIGGGSIGFPATYNSYTGLVTANHASSAGTNYINGQAYGTRELNSSLRDYAFIRQTDSTDTVTRGLYDTTKTLASGSYVYVVQGSTVGRTGRATGYSTGVVTSISVYVAGIGSDLIETNCGSDGGDSGGPYFGSPSSSSPNIAGIHIAGYGGSPTNKTTYFRGIGYLYNAGIRIQ